VIVPDIAELMVHFDRLISSVGKGDVLRGGHGDEAYLAAHLASPRRTASARFWVQKGDAAGVVELEVLDDESEQLFWRRLDGPSVDQVDAASVDQVDAAWSDMLACLDAG
jgi:hypothetical protein